ncbi:hypothetical protein PHLCEN_2v4073 [Hermanssonia centrifuga]|uniref:Uncharacterized protein n=1 Tax=Hermanssonia centrifuga TaxID=98765 RepID=A0A2R6Q5D9_9APHY|nr:hypothetical protein PHLCEN_2v4073 [Hermanssonia centrifuga]
MIALFNGKTVNTTILSGMWAAAKGNCQGMWSGIGFSRLKSLESSGSSISIAVVKLDT